MHPSSFLGGFVGSLWSLSRWKLSRDMFDADENVSHGGDANTIPTCSSIFFWYSSLDAVKSSFVAAACAASFLPMLDGLSFSQSASGLSHEKVNDRGIFLLVKSLQ